MPYSEYLCNAVRSDVRHPPRVQLFEELLPGDARGRPAWDPARAWDVAAGVAFHTVALTVVGALGLIGWMVSLWLAHRTPRWAPVPSSLLWVTATPADRG